MLGAKQLLQKYPAHRACTKADSTRDHILYNQQERDLQRRLRSCGALRGQGSCCHFPSTPRQAELHPVALAKLLQSVSGQIPGSIFVLLVIVSAMRNQWKPGQWCVLEREHTIPVRDRGQALFSLLIYL